MKKTIYFILIFSFFSFKSLSQQKFEKEIRVKSYQIPNKALQFIQNIDFDTKVKWYKEISNDGITYEAKSYYLKNLFSLEFSESGDLIDIEKKVKFRELPVITKNKILTSLQTRFNKFKIKKTQIQYIGNDEVLKELFKIKTSQNFKFQVNYEIIIKGKKVKNYFFYEFLFDNNGIVKRKLKFDIENQLNMEF